MMRLLLVSAMLLVACSRPDYCEYSEVKVGLEALPVSAKIGDTISIAVSLACTDNNKLALQSDLTRNLQVSNSNDTIHSSGAVRNQGEYTLFNSPVKINLSAVVGENAKGLKLFLATGDILDAAVGKNTLRVRYRPPLRSLGIGDSDEGHPFANSDFTITK